MGDSVGGNSDSVNDSIANVAVAIFNANEATREFVGGNDSVIDESYIAVGGFFSDDGGRLSMLMTVTTLWIALLALWAVASMLRIAILTL